MNVKSCTNRINNDMSDSRRIIGQDWGGHASRNSNNNGATPIISARGPQL